MFELRAAQTMAVEHTPELSDPAEQKERSTSVTKPAGDGEYVVEKPDPFEEVFSVNVIQPLQKLIPATVSPNHITLFNILVRAVMLYVTWSMAERPTPFTPTQYFVRSLVAAFLFIFTEIVDDLDGCHARKTNQVPFPKHQVTLKMP